MHGASRRVGSFQFPVNVFALTGCVGAASLHRQTSGRLLFLPDARAQDGNSAQSRSRRTGSQVPTKCHNGRSQAWSTKVRGFSSWHSVFKKKPKSFMTPHLFFYWDQHKRMDQQPSPASTALNGNNDHFLFLCVSVHLNCSLLNCAIRLVFNHRRTCLVLQLQPSGRAATWWPQQRSWWVSVLTESRARSRHAAEP